VSVRAVPKTPAPPTTAYNPTAQPNVIKRPGDVGYGERGQVTPGGGPAGVTFPDPAGRIPPYRPPPTSVAAPSTTVPPYISPGPPPTTAPPG
jgi:hypothetical protein